MASQTYTSGSGTFNVPAGAFNLIIEVWGGGGGGLPPPNTNGVGYGGGGGGGYARVTIASPASSYTYSVGTGGTAGNPGNNSTINTNLLIANGGGAGTTTAGGTGGGGSGSGATTYTGGNGSKPATGSGAGGGGAGSSSNGSNAVNQTGGAGGTGNPNGTGGNGATGNNTSGTAGTAYGGGGGAGTGRNGVSQPGANGAVIFTWELTTTTTTTASPTTTTTTTALPTTTTTTTTALPTTTTTTTLPACMASKFIFTYDLGFTPAGTFSSDIIQGCGIVEDSTYIFTAINHSDYLTQELIRYTKSNGQITTQTFSTDPNYAEAHKAPSLYITSSGSLLIAIEQITSWASHNSAVEIFRWSDVSTLSSYTSTVIGNSTTERLAYPNFYQVGSTIALEFRELVDSSMAQRAYYTSTNDGVSWSSQYEYVTHGDSTYWLYGGQVGNNNHTNPIIGLTPADYINSAAVYKYITYLKTDFSGDFYSLDGTNLGTNVTGSELVSKRSWGIDSDNTYDMYYTRQSKVFGDWICTIGRIGTRNGGTTSISTMQVVFINKNTGAVQTGNTFSVPLSTTSLYNLVLYNIDDTICFKVITGGNIYYYEIDDDLNGVTSLCTETGTFHGQLQASIYNELAMDLDTTNNTIRVFRFDDPDLVTLPTGLDTSTTTTTTTIGTSTTSTTTIGGSTTSTTTIAGEYNIGIVRYHDGASWKSHFFKSYETSEWIDRHTKYNQ